MKNNDPKSRREAMAARMISFSSRIITVSEALPKTPVGRQLGGQLLRSGTSPALNYGEAQAAESKNDFLHKMKICLKELSAKVLWSLSGFSY